MALCADCTARREAAPGVDDLLPDLELVSDDPAVARREPAPAAEDDLLVVDEFESIDARWMELAPDGAALGKPLHTALVTEAEGAHGLAIVGAGVGGLHARIALPSADPLLVSARVRSFANERSAQVGAANLTGARRPPRLVACPVAAGPDFTEVRVVLGACRDRKEVQISLVPGDRPLVVDRVSVRRLRRVEELWLAPRVEGAPLLPRGRHRVELAGMDAEMEGCFVPAGATLRWRTRVPRQSPRLDLETCLLGGDRGGDAAWTVAIEGVPLASRSEQLRPRDLSTAFAPWIVPLDRFAGRDVTVEVRCAGGREVVGFAGAPRVLGGPPPDRPGVVVISLDTLRPDRVGPRSGGRSLTPRLDELVARGAFFTGACSTSSWTLPAQASLLTGQHPLMHGAFDLDRAVDPRRSPLLAERFRSQGYATAAFTAGVFLDPRFGFGAGFDVYSVRDPCGLPHDAPLPAPAPDPRVASDDELDATPRRAFDWVRRHADAPFFLFLHTYHVHEYDDEEHDGVESRRLELLGRATARDPEAIRELSRRYDACVREVDRDLVGGLLDLLRELHLDERTIVAVVSDHGEEFFEHGGFRHGLTLRDEVGSVVLAMAGPGVPRAGRIDAPVSLTDVAPTLARLTGLPSEARCSGRDLFLRDDVEPRALLLHLDHVCEGVGRVRGEALWLGDWQVQRMWSASGEENLSFERRAPATGRFAAAEPSSAERRALERRLDAELAAELRRAPPMAEVGGHDLPEALRDRLEALGYTGR